MYSRAEDYRCRGIEAEQRAAQATTPNVRLAFEEVALGWFLLAGQANWLRKPLLCRSGGLGFRAGNQHRNDSTLAGCGWPIALPSQPVANNLTRLAQSYDCMAAAAE
jgi:hypothetical protein